MLQESWWRSEGGDGDDGGDSWLDANQPMPSCISATDAVGAKTDAQRQILKMCEMPKQRASSNWTPLVQEITLITYRVNTGEDE